MADPTIFSRRPRALTDEQASVMAAYEAVQDVVPIVRLRVRAGLPPPAP
ncbi:MAG: hypothetical protein JO363_23480 [Solirubrobacterales bacterium]|nr:hypothetical protein [Solirubrobacterales bacterium]